MTDSIPLWYNLEWDTGDSGQTKMYRLWKPERVFAASRDIYFEISHV